MPSLNVKAKDEVNTPHFVAMALQADGWVLRQTICWKKENPMPESVTDRCTKAHEYIFLLTKSARYFYDANAIKEPASESTHARFANGGAPRRSPKDVATGLGIKSNNDFRQATAGYVFDRNKRSVWEVATQPYSEAHFATFPPALIEPCIKAGTSAHGCCAKCGAPWVRQTETMRVKHPNTPGKGGRHTVPGSETSESSCFRTGLVPVSTTIGWLPSCKCDAEVIPCTVLDPFAGACTTGFVAKRLQRKSIMIELNEKYVKMATRRIKRDAGLFADVDIG